MLKRKEWWKRLINLQTFFLWCFSGLSFWIAIMENIIFHFSLCPGNQLYTELDSSPFASPLVERKQIKMRLLNVMSSSPFLSLHLIPVNWVNHGFSTLKEENWLYTMRLYLLYSNTFSILSSAHYCNFFFFFFLYKDDSCRISTGNHKLYPYGWSFTSHPPKAGTGWLTRCAFLTPCISYNVSTCSVTSCVAMSLYCW